MTEPQYSPGDNRGVFARYPWLHFLWAGPLACAFSACFFFMALFSVCGFGCAADGPGDREEPMAYTAIGAIVLTLPIGAVRWIPETRVRLTVMLVLAALVGGVAWAIVWE